MLRVSSKVRSEGEMRDTRPRSLVDENVRCERGGGKARAMAKVKAKAGVGEHYRIRRIEKSDLRGIIQSERTSANWAAVASHTRKRNEKREVGHGSLVLNEARRVGVLYQMRYIRDKYSTG